MRVEVVDDMNSLAMFLLAGVSSSIDRSIPLSERLAEGLKMMVLGLGTVFSILILIWGAISLMRVFMYDIPMRRKKKHAAVQVDTTDGLPSKSEKRTDDTDEGELIAAITAAVAAYRSSETEKTDVPASGFRVVSFRRR